MMLFEIIFTICMCRCALKCITRIILHTLSIFYFLRHSLSLARPDNQPTQQCRVGVLWDHQ